MMKRLTAGFAVAFTLTLGTVSRAEIVEYLPYWPGDGLWIHYVVDSSAWEVGIWIYCGFGCVEFQDLYQIPPNPLDKWIHSSTSHNHYMDRPQIYAQIQHTWGESIWHGNFTAQWDCNDARSDLNQEYVDTYSGGSMYFALGILPLCSSSDLDFQSSGGSAHFSWSELNGGWSTGNPNAPWGIVRAALTAGLEATRANYNRGGILLTSGYRTPSGNANSGGVFGSYHVRGRAADMYSSDHPWTETEFNLLRQAAADTGTTVELLNWTSYADRHLHAAW